MLVGREGVVLVRGCEFQGSISDGCGHGDGAGHREKIECGRRAEGGGRRVEGLLRSLLMVLWEKVGGRQEYRNIWASWEFGMTLGIAQEVRGKVACPKQNLVMRDRFLGVFGPKICMTLKMTSFFAASEVILLSFLC